MIGATLVLALSRDACLRLFIERHLPEVHRPILMWLSKMGMSEALVAEKIGVCEHTKQLLFQLLRVNDPLVRRVDRCCRNCNVIVEGGNE